MKEIKVGVIGFGTIGTGVVKLLQQNSSLITEKLGAKLILKSIADQNTTADRGVPLRSRRPEMSPHHPSAEGAAVLEPQLAGPLDQEKVVPVARQLVKDERAACIA